MSIVSDKLNLNPLGEICILTKGEHCTYEQMSALLNFPPKYFFVPPERHCMPSFPHQLAIDTIAL